MTSNNEGPTGNFREFIFRASAISTTGMRKEAAVNIESTSGQVVMNYDFASDESELLGGENSAPPPLAYFTSSIAFCLMTQISRYAHMRKLDVQDVQMTTVVHYRNDGSVLRGDVVGTVESVTSHVEVTSSESDETIETLVRDAERGCYVHYALTNPIEVVNQITHHMS